MRYLPFFLGAAIAQIAPFDQTLPILISPVVQAKADQVLHYQYHSPVPITRQTLPF
jgi:hypothetical protein